MALNPLVDSRDVRFVVFEMLEVDKYDQHEIYADYDKDTYEATLDLAEQVSVEQFYPTAVEGDEEGGCTFDPATNEVHLPKCYKPALDAYYEAGFMGLADLSEAGGMGMPAVMGVAANEFIVAANYAMNMYPGLTHGAMELVHMFGTDEINAIYYRHYH